MLRPGMILHSRLKENEHVWWIRRYRNHRNGELRRPPRRVRGVFFVENFADDDTSNDTDTASWNKLAVINEIWAFGKFFEIFEIMPNQTLSNVCLYF